MQCENVDGCALRLAVIGCGHWGKNLVRVFHQLGVLRLVCDAAAAGRTLAGQLAPDVPVSADLGTVLGSGIDAVAIATPAPTHYALARQALLAGKDVFVEKPLALSYEEGAHLVELAAARQRMLLVGHVLEYHPAFVRLRELVETGVLGRLCCIYSSRLSLGKVRREENVLWSFAPHDIAVALRLAGTLPTRVTCCGGAFLQAGIADTALTNLHFDDGLRVHIHVSWIHPFKEQRLVVVGSRQMATFDDVTKKLLLHDQHVDPHGPELVPLKGESREIPFDACEPLQLEAEAFLKSMRTRTPPLTDGASALRVLQVLQGAQQSLDLDGKPVDLQTVTPRRNLRVRRAAPRRRGPHGKPSTFPVEIPA